MRNSQKKTANITYKIIFFIFATILGTACWSQDQTERDVSKFNLTEEGLGLKGFDPAVYLLNENAQAVIGNKDISVKYKNVVYLFASEDNKKSFIASPDQNEPTYGGWCAWAMAQGSLVDIKPEFYLINNGRVHFFVNRRARDNFARDVNTYEKQADTNWEQILSER